MFLSILNKEFSCRKSLTTSTTLNENIDSVIVTMTKDERTLVDARNNQQGSIGSQIHSGMTRQNSKTNTETESQLHCEQPCNNSEGFFMEVPDKLKRPTTNEARLSKTDRDRSSPASVADFGQGLWMNSDEDNDTCDHADIFSVEDSEDHSSCNAVEGPNDVSDGTQIIPVNDNATARIRYLETELQAARQEIAGLKEEANAAKNQRNKTLGNLRKKRSELALAIDEKSKLENLLEQTGLQKSRLMEENASLKNGIQKLAAFKDDLKHRLKVKEEMLKDSARDVTAMRRLMEEVEQGVTTERELLEHYRKLARHTGYYKWAKMIRSLEAQLADRSAEAVGEQAQVFASHN